jgi:uncharacterized membrane protein (DUF4010 family)
MNLLHEPAWGLLVALGCGLVLGLERERTKGTGPRRRPAGIRTFALTALAGGVSTLTGSWVVVAVTGAGLVLLVAIGAWQAPREDPGITTEVALLLTFALGSLAQTAPGQALAASLAASALLAFRGRIHGLARKLFSDRELQNALALGVAALVVLPLLPDRPVDPFGAVRPFDIWKLVVLLMAVSSVAALVQRLFHPRLGLTLSGFAAGFISSAATVASMGRLARSDARALPAAVSGATASCVSTLVELAILIVASSAGLLRAVAWPLVLGVLVTGAVAVVTARSAVDTASAPKEAGPVFRFQDAVVFAVLLGGVAAAATLAQRRFGSAGVVVTAGLSGLVDAHAFAASSGPLVRGGQLEVDTAALAVLVAVSANALTKVVLGFGTGPSVYGARIALSQAALVAALWGGWALKGLL